MNRRNKQMPLLAVIVVLISATTLLAQDPDAKKPIPIDDYERWRSITSTAISDNGEWLSFAYTKREADDSLYVENAGTGQEYLLSCASRSQFSEDSKWVAYMVTLPFEEAEKLREDNEPVPDKAELLNLQTGEKISWENVASFSFSESSTHFAAKKAKVDRQAEHDGTDLILRNLQEDYEELIGSVATYSFNKPGTMLAYTVDTADKDGNGLYLIFLDSDQRRPLDNGKVRYERMTWEEEGTALAVLKGDESEDFEERENVLLAYTELRDGRFNTFTYDPAEATDFPEGMVISEKGSLSWNEDATRVFFGIKEQKEKKDKGEGRSGSRDSTDESEDTGEEQAVTEEEEEEEDPVADVDIWHWQDDQIQSVQMVRANQDRNRTHSSVFNLESEKFVQLTDDEMRTFSVTRDGRWGIGQNDRAYISDWE